MSHIGELQMSIEYSVGILFFKTIIIFLSLKVDSSVQLETYEKEICSLSLIYDWARHALLSGQPASTQSPVTDFWVPDDYALCRGRTSDTHTWVSDIRC